MVNKANCIKVAERIEREPENFNIDDFFCGTQACIAGWCYILKCEEEGSDIDVYRNGLFYVDVAQEYLGIRDDLGVHLFYSSSAVWEDYEEVTPEVAVKVLRQIADGTIDLSIYPFPSIEEL